MKNNFVSHKGSVDKQSDERKETKAATAQKITDNRNKGHRSSGYNSGTPVVPLKHTLF